MCKAESAYLQAVHPKIGCDKKKQKTNKRQLAAQNVGSWLDGHLLVRVALKPSCSLAKNNVDLLTC